MSGWLAMIRMDVTLEYLIKAQKQVCTSLWNTEAVGAGNSERNAKASAQGSLAGGNTGNKGWKWNQWELCRWKGTNLEKARFIGRELRQTVGEELTFATHSGCGCLSASRRTATASPILEQTSVSHSIKWECWNILAMLHRKLIINSAVYKSSR